MSRLEEQMALQLRGAGLRFSREVGGLVAGRRYRVDFLVEDRVALEVEGGVWTRGRHVRGKGYEADCEKYNALWLAGWPPLRVTGGMVRDGRALHWVEEALLTSPAKESSVLKTTESIGSCPHDIREPVEECTVGTISVGIDARPIHPCRRCHRCGAWVPKYEWERILAEEDSC